MKSPKTPTNPGADSGHPYSFQAPPSSGSSTASSSSWKGARANDGAVQCSPAAPMASPPSWSRYIDSRLKQFGTR